MERRPETDSGWLGSDAGEYCGETGENCEAGVLSTCEPGETAEPAALAWLPNILSRRRRAPRCLPLPGTRAKGVGVFLLDCQTSEIAVILEGVNITHRCHVDKF